MASRGLPRLPDAAPGFCKPPRLCHPDAPLKTCQTSEPTEGKGPAKQVAGGGGRGWRDGCKENPGLFWRGWEGSLGPFCLRDHRGGVEGQRGIWWPQNGEGIHTLAGEEKREREGSPV